MQLYPCFCRCPLSKQPQTLHSGKCTCALSIPSETPDARSGRGRRCNDRRQRDEQGVDMHNGQHGGDLQLQILQRQHTSDIGRVWQRVDPVQPNSHRRLGRVHLRRHGNSLERRVERERSRGHRLRG